MFKFHLNYFLNSKKFLFPLNDYRTYSNNLQIGFSLLFELFNSWRINFVDNFKEFTLALLKFTIICLFSSSLNFFISNFILDMGVTCVGLLHENTA